MKYKSLIIFLYFWLLKRNIIIRWLLFFVFHFWPMNENHFVFKFWIFEFSFIEKLSKFQCEDIMGYAHLNTDHCDDGSCIIHSTHSYLIFNLYIYKLESFLVNNGLYFKTTMGLFHIYDEVILHKIL